MENQDLLNCLKRQVDHLRDEINKIKPKLSPEQQAQLNKHIESLLPPKSIDELSSENIAKLELDHGIKLTVYPDRKLDTGLTRLEKYTEYNTCGSLETFLETLKPTDWRKAPTIIAINSKGSYYAFGGGFCHKSTKKKLNEAISSPDIEAYIKKGHTSVHIDWSPISV